MQLFNSAPSEAGGKIVSALKVYKIRISVYTFDDPTPSILLLGNTCTPMSFTLKTLAEIHDGGFLFFPFWVVVSFPHYGSSVITVISEGMTPILERKIRDKKLSV